MTTLRTWLATARGLTSSTAGCSSPQPLALWVSTNWVVGWIFKNDTIVTFVLSLQGTFAFSLIKYTPLKYNNEYVYPWWGYVIGWLLALSSMVCIPLWMAYKISTTQGTLREVMLIWKSVVSSQVNRSYNQIEVISCLLQCKRGRQLLSWHNGCLLTRGSVVRGSAPTGCLSVSLDKTLNLHAVHGCVGKNIQH